MYKRILIGTDGSPLSDHAVQQGVELASALKADLIIATVGAPYTPPLYAGDLVPNNYVTADAHDEHVRAAGQEILDAALAVAQKAGLQADTAFEIADEPADGLIKIAKDKQADLIVVASHGRSGLSALLLGSATRRLLSSANLDLLVIRNHGKSD
ncbi:MAG: universal stress protein [Lautropia sp.]|nr:universal stress protein [Lautropia sp.]